MSALRRSGVLAALLMLPGAIQAQGAPRQITTSQLHGILAAYVAARGKAEGITGAALYVDAGKGTRPVEGFAGDDGLDPPRPIASHHLFQIGSNTKHFTAALMLILEARGLLTIDQRVGDFLPQYPAWRGVTIRSLLNMTAGLPNYSEVPAIGRTMAADIHHQFTGADLIAAVYPGTGFPKPSSYFYSNTNNILASMIIEKVTHKSFRQALADDIFTPQHLAETYYEDGTYPADVVQRLPRGTYDNAACLLYQPKPCTAPTLGPLIGRDMRAQNMSWAAAAGAIVASPADLAKWVRALFAMQVLPRKQFDEMTELVSQKTGGPVADVSAADPSRLRARYRPDVQSCDGWRFLVLPGGHTGFPDPVRLLAAIRPAGDRGDEQPAA